MPRFLDTKEPITTKQPLRFPKMASINPDGTPKPNGGAGHSSALEAKTPAKRKTKDDIKKEARIEKNEKIKSFIASEPKKADVREYLLKRIKELTVD